MTSQNLLEEIEKLTPMQQRAVDWNGGPLLVLAGPGSGTTRVLTHRIAQLLNSTPDERFRVLGLTFTNKAAHEMKTRVSDLVPNAFRRAEINTFHGFCAQLLGQHGVHCGVKPNFEIFSQTVDRQAVLEDALRCQAERFENDHNQFLPMIDKLIERLVSPDDAVRYLKKNSRLKPTVIENLGLAYRLYEEELSKSNALDFNSLILLAFELLSHSVFVQHCQSMYRYWLIDELQDTNDPQYRLLKRMAAGSFRNLFVVADDDQTIYEWNGANVRRISSLKKDFKCEVLQLLDNFRCPASVVEASNRLVEYNTSKGFSKSPAKSADTINAAGVPIECNLFPTEEHEATGVAKGIASLDQQDWGETVVLSRTRAPLVLLKQQLDELNVPSNILGRRGKFESAQMRWLVACLKQINRPLDQRNMDTLIDAYNTFTGVAVEHEDVHILSASQQITLFDAWLDLVRQEMHPALPFVEAVARLASNRPRLGETVKKVTEYFCTFDRDDDLSDDLNAWQRIEREIRGARGDLSLDQYLQEMELRSKEPTPAQGAVSLSTIHGVKGLEFERVYLIGLAEGVFPHWKSLETGRDSAAIEEERRTCFVAITRTKQRLILSRAESYRGFSKEPSRFLAEMGLHC
ncbi:MAG: ATP-dependent helicase [Gammaproteobacteria bacterium]|nr:ATP-dependent helicase [Gammaproteobacteria bacterium]